MATLRPAVRRRVETVAYVVFVLACCVAGGPWGVTMSPPDPEPWHWVRASALVALFVAVSVWYWRRRRADLTAAPDGASR